MDWKEKSFWKITEFFTKHSPLLKREDRNIIKHSLVLVAGINSLVEEMKDEYSFIDEQEFEQISNKLGWVFNQLLILLRIHYNELSELENYEEGFIHIDPLGKVTIDQRVYNIPKHMKSRGMFPSLIEDAWVKVYDNRKTQEGHKG